MLMFSRFALALPWDNLYTVCIAKVYTYSVHVYVVGYIYIHMCVHVHERE